MDMKKTTLSARDFLVSGDIAGLLEHRRALHGATTMTAPVDESDHIVVPKPKAPTPAARQFTQEEVNALIADATKKTEEGLSPQILEARRVADEAAAKFATFQQGLDDAKKAQKEAEDLAAAAAEEKRLAELDLGGRFDEMKRSSEAQIAALQTQFQTQSATLAKEREFSELSAYRQQALADNAQSIMPHLVPFVSGNTREEIDASISAYVEASNGILGEITQARTAQIQGAPGVGVTAPTTGPMDANGGHQSFSPADIAAMSMSDYAKYRSGLLGAASQTSDRGLLG